MQSQSPYKNTQLIKDFWKFISPRKGEFIFLSILLAIASLLSLVSPIIIAEIIDYFVEGNTAFRPFFWYLAALLGTLVIENSLGLGTKHYFNLFTIKVQKQAKVQAMQKVLQGDLLWHDKENTGNKMQRVNEGEKAIENFLRFYINQGLTMVITIIGIVAVFAFFNIKYSIIAILYLTIYLFFEFKLNKKVAEKVHQIKIAQEQASGKAYEFSSNIQTIKSLGIEKSTTSQILDKEEAVLKARNERRNASTKKWLIVELISTIFFVIFIFMVGRDVILGLLSVGSIVIYIDYTRRLGRTLNFMSSIINIVIEMKFSLFRMMQIFTAIPDYDESHAKDLEKWKKISIKNVNFKYKKEGVLENLNVEIKKGEKIGIVGTSGTGKSTLFKLLLKLYLPKKGEILFDDTSTTNIKRDSIVSKIAIVPQETELFNLTVKENITISETNKVDKKRYKKALEISKADKIIKKLKEGEQTIIGEKGVRISGGERQRIGIARAIYKNTDIIIFDEATSSLDYATEKKILEQMDKQLKGKTLIIAAHRLDTLKNMDKILFIERGRVVEQGTYTELKNKNGKFSKLLDQQRKRKTK